MSQIKIYALDETIELHRDNLSKAIHQALVKELMAYIIYYKIICIS